jgi:NADPH:quinone reductase-like Zn-dependent oxidoreductase
MKTMKALRFDAMGDLSNLRLEDVARPVPGPGELLVEVRAASINPSDVKNVQGKMEGTTLPRTPGRDFAGVVVEGAPEWIGAEVWGAGGEIGYERDGSHAEYILVPQDGVSRKPRAMSYEEAASVGVNFMAAYLGVHDALHLGAGETLFVTGAAGGVGSSVVQLARWMGATSIGFDRAFPDDVPTELLPDIALSGNDDIVGRVRDATRGAGADAVFDTVGSPLFEKNLALLRAGGRYTIIASAGERRATFDLLDFYHKRLTLIGVDTRAHHSREAAQTLDRLRPGFDSGALRAPHIVQRLSLAEAIEGYRDVDAGAKGKIVIVRGTG